MPSQNSSNHAAIRASARRATAPLKQRPQQLNCPPSTLRAEDCDEQDRRRPCMAEKHGGQLGARHCGNKAGKANQRRQDFRVASLREHVDDATAEANHDGVYGDANEASVRISRADEPCICVHFAAA